MTSLSQSTCYNSSLTEAPLWLRLPVELHMLIFSYCDYFTLKQIQRVCKFFKPLLDTTYLNSELFWPTPKPLSPEDLQKIAKKRSFDNNRFTFRLHPIIRDSVWCTKDVNVGPVVLDSDTPEAEKFIPLADLAIRNESATFPAVSRMAYVLVTIRRYGSRPFSVDILNISEKTIYRTATVQDVVQVLNQTTCPWKTPFGSNVTDIVRERPDPDEVVSASLAPDGWVEFHQRKLSFDSSDDKPIPGDADR